MADPAAAVGTVAPLLSESDLVAYLRGIGLLGADEPVTVRRLSGGYINVVYRVFRADGADLVVKQSLEQSERTVLRADIGRADVEVRVMRALKRVVGDDCPTPWVLADDPDRHVVVMRAAPRDAVLYDDELGAGRLPAGVGRQIGDYLARLHECTRGDRALAREFGHNPGFQLRDQSIRSAVVANPDLGPVIDLALRRNREQAEALVDADITPKNVLLHDGGITKLDFECAQWGHPAFDLGVAVAHYALHAVARPALAGGLLDEAAACVTTYTAARPAAGTAEFFRAVADYTALMMLGRCDGDLVFGYLVAHRPCVNHLVRSLLAARIDEPGDMFAFLARATALPHATGSGV